MSDYWKTCIEEAVSEIGISATEEHIKELVEWVEGAHENYSMAHGHDCIPNPLRTALDQTYKELEKEKTAQFCGECNSTGVITESFGVRSSTSSCWKCNGKGKIYN